MKLLRDVILFGFCLVPCVRSQLLTHSHLQSNCYGFPDKSFDYSNSVKSTYGSSPHLMLETGASAIDFTLHDVNANPWNLREALYNGGGKPVALIWGMSTCPAFQGLDSEQSSSRWTYWDEYNLVESHHDKAIFVHVYGPEPHPQAPDHNFDSGRLLANYWSVQRQAVMYAERVAAAEGIRHMLHPDQVIVPDYLQGNPYTALNNPVWCSYANGARSAVLISKSGNIFYQQDWLNTDDLGKAIDAYWEQGGRGIWSNDKQQKAPKVVSKEAGTSKKKGRQEQRSN